MGNTLRAAAGINFQICNSESSTLHLLWWHQLIFHQRVTVVLRAVERSETQAFASLSTAARTLTSLQWRVIIDAARNSLDDAAWATGLEDVLEERLCRENCWRTCLKQMLVAVQEARLADMVCAVLNLSGIPIGMDYRYRSLSSAWDKSGRTHDDTVQVTTNFLQHRLAQSLAIPDVTVPFNNTHCKLSVRYSVWHTHLDSLSWAGRLRNVTASDWHHERLAMASLLESWLHNTRHCARSERIPRDVGGSPERLREIPAGSCQFVDQSGELTIQNSVPVSDTLEV